MFYLITCIKDIQFFISNDSPTLYSSLYAWKKSLKKCIFKFKFEFKIDKISWVKAIAEQNAVKSGAALMENSVRKKAIKSIPKARKALQNLKKSDSPERFL